MTKDFSNPSILKIVSLFELIIDEYDLFLIFHFAKVVNARKNYEMKPELEKETKKYAFGFDN